MPHRRVIPLVTAVASIATSAAAQPELAVYPSNEGLREVFNAARAQRIALVGIGDSNQLFDTQGWEAAWHWTLAGRYGLWGTSLVSAGEDYGFSSSIGTGAGVQAAAPQNNGSFQFTSAPETCGYWLSVFPGISPAGYLYVPVESEIPGTATPHGMVLTGASGLDLSARLRFSFTHALFEEGRTLNAFVSEGNWGGSVIAQQKFSTDGPRSSPASGAPQRPRGEGHGGGHPVPAPIVTDSIELPPDPQRSWSLRLWFGDDRGRARGPLFLTYMHAENPDRATGAAVHTLYGLGGSSTRDMAAAIVGAPIEQLLLYFQRIRESLGPNPRVVVRISSGVNDRSEWMPSVYSGYLPGSSPDAFNDNITAIIRHLRLVWQINQWDAESELHFLVCVSPPLSQPDDPYLTAYRSSIFTLANRYPNVTIVDLSRLANTPELTRRGWYRADDDHFHLSPAGHAGVAGRELDVLTRQACHNPADNDNNGSVNTRDLLRLLEDFGNPGITPGWGGDLDADGDCDVADLVVLLGAFGAQTCNGK